MCKRLEFADEGATLTAADANTHVYTPGLHTIWFGKHPGSVPSVCTSETEPAVNTEISHINSL